MTLSRRYWDWVDRHQSGCSRAYKAGAVLLLVLLAFPFLPLIIPLAAHERMQRLETLRAGHRA